MTTKAAIAVLARLMIEHGVCEGTEAHKAYRQAVAAIEAFESVLKAQADKL